MGLISLGQGGSDGGKGGGRVQVPAGKRAWLQAPGEDMSAPSLQGFKRGRKALKDMVIAIETREVQVVLKTSTHHESQVLRLR